MRPDVEKDETAGGRARNLARAIWDRIQRMPDPTPSAEVEGQTTRNADESEVEPRLDVELLEKPVRSPPE